MERSPYEPLEQLSRGARLRGEHRGNAHAWFSNVLLRMTFMAVVESAFGAAADVLANVGERATYPEFERASQTLFAERGGALFDPASGAFEGATIEDEAFARASTTVRALANEIGTAALGAVHECLLEYDAEFCVEPMLVVPRKRRPGEPTTDDIVPIDDTDAVASPKMRSGARRLEAGELALNRTLGRRQAGSHYTSRDVANEVVRATLDPLVRDSNTSAALLLTVCDPAMGSGAFLVAALEWFSSRGADRAFVAKTCLFGVDRDPMAVTLARHVLWIAAGAREERFTFVDHALVVGDALAKPPRGLDWEKTFDHVMVRGGFSAIVGNPPWVSYAGRAAQPLEDDLRAWYIHRYRSFARYRNLQGLFVERAVELLAPEGRLGFVLPSSMSELGGYAPVRAIHDAHSVCDESLPDLGDGGFEDVFQPSMVLLSTKRKNRNEYGRGDAWPLARADLDDVARGILGKLDREALPATTFGERGLQSLTTDGAYFRPESDEKFSVALRVGGDIEPFLCRPPRTYANAAHFGSRLRSPQDWRNVAVVVRQTARYPIAARWDGCAFRNSLLACFASEHHPADFLVAYLNSTPVRFSHYMRHRDARNGMPQVKIGHLRTIPAPPNEALVASLAELGKTWSSRNDGIRAEEQRMLDEQVAAAFDLTATERVRIEAWAQSFAP